MDTKSRGEGKYSQYTDNIE